MSGRRARIALRDRARALVWRLWLRLGGFGRLRRVAPERVTRLVFVCKGNVCRSPYAEAVAAAAGFAAVSAGLRTCGGIRANRRARAVAKKRGVNLREHRSRPIEAVELGPGDLLVAMEPDQARRLAPLAAASGAQVTLLGLWAPRLRPSIHDPFGRAPRLFWDCFAQIDAAVGGLGAALRRRTVTTENR